MKGRGERDERQCHRERKREGHGDEQKVRKGRSIERKKEEKKEKKRRKQS